MGHLLNITLAGLSLLAGLAFLAGAVRRRTVEAEPSARAEAARMLAALTAASTRQPSKGAGPPIVVVPPPADVPATARPIGGSSTGVVVIAVLVTVDIVQLVIHLRV